nr:hypothetical protein [Nanoarchaeum sp.]
MRYLVVSDIHGKLLEKLNPIVDDGIDSLICLGDFDQVRSIRSFMDLQARLEQDGKQVIVVPGNHDYEIYKRGKIKSPELKKQRKTSLQLHKELFRDELASNYIRDLLDRPHHYQDLLLGGDYSTIIVHGGLRGSLISYLSCPKKAKDLWYRLEKDYYHRTNFKAMEEKGYNIMIRGHDHMKSCVSFSDGKVKPIRERPVTLEPGKLYTINPGSWFNRNYLVIDCSDEQPVVEFRKV